MFDDMINAGIFGMIQSGKTTLARKSPGSSGAQKANVDLL